MLWNVRVAIPRIFNITWCSRNIDIQKMRPMWVNDFSGRKKWNSFRFSLAAIASPFLCQQESACCVPDPPCCFLPGKMQRPSLPPRPPPQPSQRYPPPTLLTSPSPVLPFALQIGKHESPELIWLPFMCQEQGRVVTQHCPTLLISVL